MSFLLIANKRAGPIINALARKSLAGDPSAVTGPPLDPKSPGRQGVAQGYIRRPTGTIGVYTLILVHNLGLRALL
jgi:hypothetical protein